MSAFHEEIKNIYRLKIPFDTVYTSVFLIKSENGAILVDCATTAEDVKFHVVPALRAMGYELSDISALVLTHTHSDHAGGLSQVLELAPDVEIIKDVREIFDGISTYSMAGHTEDCIGVFDERSHTLISGDGLQGAGVDKYRCYIKSPEAYIHTIGRIRNDSIIENILFSHAYEPWSDDRALGRRDVEKCLDECIKYMYGEKK